MRVMFVEFIRTHTPNPLPGEGEGISQILAGSYTHEISGCQRFVDSLKIRRGNRNRPGNNVLYHFVALQLLQLRRFDSE